MSDVVWQAIIAGVVTITLSIIQIVAAVVLMQTQIKLKKELGDDIKEVAHNTNSIKDELVKEVREASFAAGQKDQKDKANPPSVSFRRSTMFQPKDRVTVNAPGTDDHGKQGTVKAYDPDDETCSVLLDGDKSEKDFDCHKLTANAKP